MIGLEILKKRVKVAPQSSGVYLFKNKKDIPIYIGKAINIKRRLSNYGNLPKLPRRLQKMVSQTINIEFELTESERNALLLEALLIKKFSPRYNIRLKDDKSFPLIKITNDQFPRLTRFRNDFHKDDRVFGPFTSALKTDKVIKILQKREVFEEVGVKVKNIRYFHSQPWPFPASLMLGFFAEAETTKLDIDYNEIEDAHWFSIEELKSLEHPSIMERCRRI